MTMYLIGCSCSVGKVISIYRGFKLKYIFNKKLIHVRKFRVYINL